MRRLRSALQIGDQVEKALQLVGITPEKVEAFTGKPCKCKERKQRMNQLGNWAYRVLSGETENAENELNKIVDENAK